MEGKQPTKQKRQGEGEVAKQGEISEDAENGAAETYVDYSCQYTGQPQQMYEKCIWVFTPLKGYVLHQFYEAYFENILTLNKELANNENPKWTPNQASYFRQYLSDLNNYIRKNVNPMGIAYFEQYEQMMAQYNQYNPIGYELFMKQADYLEKKSSGYDFKLDKKKNSKVEEVKKREPVQRKQEVVIRMGDPKIELEELMAKEWSTQEYIDIKLFKKESVNLVFIGHVDSGKSTLTGNILKQLNEVDEQEWIRNKLDAKNNRMESWELAGVSDVIAEERADGKTRQCAKLMFNLQKKRFTLFDAPGHKNYVPNMMMGACQADIAVLIVSAKEGEFESGFEKEGQTKEHAMLARALGVEQLMVAVTKMGVVDWSQKRFELIRSQVEPFLRNSCGFNNVAFIPLESLENQNIHKRHESKWYSGPCLLEYLNEIKISPRTPMGPLRIPIIDKFKNEGQLYIYGKIESGTIIEDQTVSLLPSRKQLVLKEIFNAKDEKMPFAMAGENVKIRVRSIQEDQIHRGDVACNNLNYCQESSEFKATLTVLQLPEKKKLLSSGYECVIHMHAIAEEVEISKVEAKYDPVAKKNVPVSFLKTGEVGIVTIKIANPVCMEKHDFMPCLGRFTLRDEGKTIGYGEVTRIKPAKTLQKEQKEQLQQKTKPKDLEGSLQQMQISQNPD